MSIGEKILSLRKEKNLSQEEVANELNVSRQTVSKWETDQSLPDFDKIVPLCNLFSISTDELLKGEKRIDDSKLEQNENHSNAVLVCIGIFFYFLSIIGIALGQSMGIDEELSVCIFLSLCAIGTIILIYNDMTKTKIHKEKPKPNPLFRNIAVIIFTIFLIIYLFISFITEAWHITWLIWLIFMVTVNITKLIFDLKGEKNEK